MAAVFLLTGVSITAAVAAVALSDAGTAAGLADDDAQIAHDLIASPAFIVMKAADEFKDKTTAPKPALADRDGGRRSDP